MRTFSHNIFVCGCVQATVVSELSVGGPDDASAAIVVAGVC